MDDAVFFLLLVAISVVPSIVLTVWMRNREGHGREPWASVAQAFLYGSIIGTTAALILNTVFGTAAYYYGLSSTVTGGLLTAIVIAPIAEEAIKAAGLGFHRRAMLELEDGLVYGAAIGFGFAATENLIYGASAWLESGQAVAAQTVFLRAISSTILHGGAAALVGFGYSRAVLSNGFGAGQVLPYYLVAVGLHSVYNLLVGFETVAGVAAAVVMVWAIVTWANSEIGRLDAMPHQR